MDPNANPATDNRTRDQRWAQDGIKQLPLPPGMHQISMRGGQTLASPAPGDDIDLYTDAGKGKGTWVSGFVAQSGVQPGEMGGPYDGEDVVMVGKDGEEGAEEWPAEYVRLSRGAKPAFYEQQSDVSFAADRPGAVVSLAEFFRPDQLRGYHGRWVDEGKGNLRSRRPMVNAQVPDAIVGETAKQEASGMAALRAMGYTPEEMERRALAIYDLMDEATAKEYGSWYYEVHDLAWEWAQKYDIRPEMVAGVIATLSPQVKWGEPGDSPKIFLNANQGYAWKILRMVYEQGNREVVITPERMREGNMRSKSKSGKINYESYNGKDLSGDFKGRNFIGTFKVKDLPGDILWQLFPKDLKGMMQPRATAAFMLARGMHPDAPVSKRTTVLNGPKIRSFYNNIINPDASMDATIDVHMLRALTSLATTTEQGAKLVGSSGAYKMMSDTLARAARKRGVKPHEFQAAVWLKWRDLNNPAKKAALTRAAKALIRR